MTARPTIPLELRQRLAIHARHRCGYCLSSVALTGSLMTIDHIIPLALGGTTDEANLWLACRRCNEYKHMQTHGSDPESGDTVALFHPRQQLWSDHFSWSNDGTHIQGITACGRVTVIALQLNHATIVTTRRMWVSVGWWPPYE